MSEAPRVARGGADLRRLLGERSRDLRGLDVAGFRDWIDHHLARWRRDPVFVQQTAIRDLRRAHPRLCLLEERRRLAAEADAASPHSARLDRLEQELADAGKAVAGLSAALRQAPPDREPALRHKLDAFRTREGALREERAELVGSSPERQALLRAEAELREMRAAFGLEREEARLAELRKRQGRRSGSAGRSFEDTALDLTREHLIPELSPGGVVLRGVTLGAARTEIDQLVVLPSGDGEGPVEVLAVVEAKRNPNDLAHGFRQRQENLAWLTGDTTGYDPDQYRTRHFRSGHFDREARHSQEGSSFAVARESFHRFRRDPVSGLFLHRLYFITREATLWGLSTAALGRIRHRVATDERWEAESPVYLSGLLEWCRSLAEPLEAPDVLRIYAANPELASQVLLASR